MSGIGRNAFVLAVICYLVGGAGMFSDDFPLVLMLRELTPSQMLFPGTSSAATPLTHLTHAWFYYLIQDGPAYLYDCVKAAYLFLSVTLLSRFFSLWFGAGKSLVSAALFAFYPVHDAVTYWFIGQYLLLSFAFFAYSFYLMEKDRPRAAMLAGIMGSFESYGSPALAVGLALIFIVRRDFRRAFLFVLPNIIYVVYYLTLTVYMGKGVARVPDVLDPLILCKQFLLQMATFIDAAVGPSFWLKMGLAFGQISLVTALVAGLVLFAIARLPAEPEAPRPPKELLLGALGVTVAAFAMFALTGRYPQLAFNLGDRVTIFGNFLIVALIASLPLKRAGGFAVIAVYLFAIGGVSDHWKSWQQQQQTVMRNISHNPQLLQNDSNVALYVSGNQYSSFGGISHIEFLSENFLAQSVVVFSLRRPFGGEVIALNQRYRAEGEILTDRKYGDKRRIGQSIRVYDSVGDRVFDLPAADINAYLEQLPAERRTWVQFLGDGILRRSILFLMPRLDYAF